MRGLVVALRHRTAGRAGHFAVLPVSRLLPLCRSAEPPARAGAVGLAGTGCLRFGLGRGCCAPGTGRRLTLLVGEQHGQVLS